MGMFDDVKCLYRPGYVTPPAGGGAPRGGSRAALDARGEIAEFLDANLARPQSMSGDERQAQLDDALTTMTVAERVFVEIEMQERRRAMYSSDYDPLR